MKIFNESIPTKAKPASHHCRCGYAPVEMTLVLPLLMLMMAVIMVFGINACWKIRTEVVARDVTWRNRHPHKGVWNANRAAQNPEWTSETEDDGRNEIVFTSTSSGSNLTVFDDEDVLNAIIIRGEIQNLYVDSDLLNFSRSVDQGRARIRRQPTILPKTGLVDFDTEHQFIGDLFQHGLMGISNSSRRFPKIYESELDSLNDSAAIQSARSYVQSVRDPDCLAIDEDAEFLQDPRRQNTRPNCRYPDYHARLNFSQWRRQAYTLDKEWVKGNVVNPLVENSVPNVPTRMVSGTIALYKRIQEVAPPGEFNQWQSLIDELELYLQTLREP